MSVEDAVGRLPDALWPESGRLFYTGRTAFERASELYVLGLNPGGSPDKQADETIARDLDEWKQRPASWSAYVDDSWGGKPSGAGRMQRRVRHLFRALCLDIRAVPASNVVFVRTATEAALTDRKAELLQQCWPVHEMIIHELDIRTILCLGKTAGRWCRDRLGATHFAGDFREQNNKGWTSKVHLAIDGRAVVTLTHPSRANWRNPSADPTPLVRAVLERNRDVSIPRRPESVDKRQLDGFDVPGVDASWDVIEAFSLTYNGYEANGSFEACAKIANARRHETVNDLRTCLFFEQRRWRHFGDGPDSEAIAYARSLVLHLRVKLSADRPNV